MTRDVRLTAIRSRSRRRWRKLHLGVDARSGQIVAVTLTDQAVSDKSRVGPLLEHNQSLIEQVAADGAYDGEPTYQTTATHDSAIAVVIPPQDYAVPSAGFVANRRTAALPGAMPHGAPKPWSAPPFSIACSMPQGPTPSAVRRRRREPLVSECSLVLLLATV